MKKHIQDFNRFSVNESKGNGKRINEGITPGEDVYATNFNGEEWYDEEHLMNDIHMAVANRNTIFYIWNPNEMEGADRGMDVFMELISLQTQQAELDPEQLETVIRPIQNKEIVKVFGIEALEELLDNGTLSNPEYSF